MRGSLWYNALHRLSRNRKTTEKGFLHMKRVFAAALALVMALSCSAVALADSRAGEGDVVLLSPASTSFDRFANFMERGRVFKEIVNALD